MRGRIVQWLASHRIGAVCTLVAVLLSLPALTGGLQADDYFLFGRYTDQPSYRALRSFPWDGFKWVPSGVPDRLSWTIDHGFSPWWGSPGGQVRFFRPLSSLTHWLDFTLLSLPPWAMHLHSVLWYGLVVWLASRLYRRLLGPAAVAGLASVMYAVDFSHGVPVGWIANRNSVLATACGLASLLLHRHGSETRRARFTVLGALLFGGALSAGEAGLATAGFLFSYAVTLDTRTWRQRVLSLCPSLLVGLLWAVVYRLGHFGVRGGGLYVDPITRPLRFVQQLVPHSLLLLAGEILGPLVDLSIVMRREQRWLLWGAAALSLAVFVRVIWPLLRRDRVAQFFALGTLLSVLPSTATFPSVRLLVFASFGWLGLLSQLCAAVWFPAEDRVALPASPTWLTRGVAGLLGGLHSVLSPLIFLSTIGQIGLLDRQISALTHTLPSDAQLTSQRLVFVDIPDVLYGFYTIPWLAAHHRPAPRAMLELSVGTIPIQIQRTSDRVLEFRSASGLLGGGFSTLNRSVDEPFSVGETVHLDDVSIEITALAPSGQPSVIRITFAAPLEDPRYRFVAWEARGWVAWSPPPVGQSTARPARPHPFLQLLSAPPPRPAPLAN